MTVSSLVGRGGGVNVRATEVTGPLKRVAEKYTTGSLSLHAEPCAESFERETG